MMLMPRKNDFDLFDDLFYDDFLPAQTKKERYFMKTDVKESKDKYLLDIDLPGFDKSNINMSLKNGYLNIHAKIDKEEKNDEDEKFVHQERFHGECSRSFYVGKEVKAEDVKAEFKNGILKVEIPKKEAEDKSKEIKQIPIK